MSTTTIEIVEETYVVDFTGGGEEFSVEWSEEAVELLELIEQGPAGRDGGDSTIVNKTAAQNLSGHRVVRSASASVVDYADNQTANHKNLILGVTIGAASSGAPVQVRVAGEMTETGWSWIPGELIFCGANGLLTQSAPTTGFLCVIGTAISPTTIYVDIRQSITLI
jgi:hypothetical protein